MKVMAAPAREPYLHSLDLLRGIAAMSVCLYHTGFLLTSRVSILPGGYLCVDLFFLLSGFVIARTYDPRIAEGMTLGAFSVQRLARLYPLFLATTLVGFLAVNARLYEEFHTYGGRPLFLTLFGNLFLIPNVLRPFDIQSMFPFNGASWSIFFEFYVNILFFVCWPLLTLRRIAAFVVVSAVLMAAAAARAHSLDIGTKTYDLFLTIPRVTFSFFLGVLIDRTSRRGPGRLGAWSALFGVGVVLASLCLRGWLPEKFVWIGDVFTVTVVFPLVVLAFSQLTLVRAEARVGAFLGNISYSVYLLQTPLLVIYSAMPRVLYHESIARFAPWAGLVFIPAITGGAFLVWKYFEVPAKRAVRRWHVAIAGTLSELA